MANVAYIRVSTTTQNTDRQEVALANMDKVFTDKLSGKNTQRSELQNMLEYVREGDTINIYSLDRLGRNTLDVLRLIENFASKGIGLKVVNNSTFNMVAGSRHNPQQKLMLTIMAGVAEMEREWINERSLAGIEAKKAKNLLAGKKATHGFGRPTAIDSKNKAIMRLVNEGKLTKQAIADQVGVGVATVYRIIKRSVIEAR
jgi:DNA invertase Pin-like site-specific DNA recombinase